MNVNMSGRNMLVLGWVVLMLSVGLAPAQGVKKAYIINRSFSFEEFNVNDYPVGLKFKACGDLGEKEYVSLPPDGEHPIDRSHTRFVFYYAGRIVDADPVYPHAIDLGQYTYMTKAYVSAPQIFRAYDNTAEFGEWTDFEQALMNGETVMEWDIDPEPSSYPGMPVPFLSLSRIPHEIQIEKEPTNVVSSADLEKGENSLFIPPSSIVADFIDIDRPMSTLSVVKAFAKPVGEGEIPELPSRLESWRVVGVGGGPLSKGTLSFGSSLDTAVPNVSGYFDYGFWGLRLHPYEWPNRRAFVEVLDDEGKVAVRVAVNVAEGKGCSSCLNCGTETKIGSVDLNVNLGADQIGAMSNPQQNSLTFYQEDILNDGVAKINVNGQNVMRDMNGDVMSVKTGQQLARVDVLGPASSGYQDANRFRIRVSSDVNNPDATVYRELVIENVTDDETQALQLQITETLHGKTTVVAYEKPDENTWLMMTGSGLRRETKISQKLGDDTIERSMVEEKMTDESYEIVSDVKITNRGFDWGVETIERVIDPDGAVPKVTTFSYYLDGEDSSSDNSNATYGYSRLKQKVFPNGETETYYYTKSETPVNGYTHSYIVKSSFAGVANAREVKTYSMAGESTEALQITEKLVEEWVNGILISKQKILTEVDDACLTSERRVYSDANTFLSYFMISDPRSTITINPDGTGSISTKQSDTVNDTITNTMTQGYWTQNGGEDQLVVLSKNVTTTNIDGEVIQSKSYQYGDNGSEHLAAHKVATAQDAFDRVTEYTHFPASYGGDEYTTQNEYGCCGLMRSRDRAGMDTRYTRDALNRVTKTNQLGVTTETVYNGLTTSVHRYTEDASGGLLSTSLANATNETSRTVVNLQGDVVEQWSRTGFDGSLVKTSTLTEYNLGNGIGRKITVSPPITADDQGVQPQSITEYYTDGRVFRSTGTLGVNQQYSYAASVSGVSGIATTRSLLDTDGVTQRETVTTTSDWLGRSVRTQFASDADGVGGNDFSSQEYNAVGQLFKTTSLDGVATLYEYNVKGQRVKQAVDINNNGAIEPGTDRIVETMQEVANGSAPRSGSVSRSTTMVHQENSSGSVVATVVSRSEQSLDGQHSWTSSYVGTPYETTARTETKYTGAGNWNTLSINSDGTGSRSYYVNGLLDHVTSTDKKAKEIFTQSFGYDGMNRRTTVTDSRLSGNSSITYVNDHTDMVKTSTDTSENVTNLSYDKRNRQVSVDAPDSLDSTGALVSNITNQQYYPDGQLKEVSGDQTYRKSYTYDYANRPQTLTTYGTTTAVTRWKYDLNRGWLTEKLYNSPTEEQGNGPSYTYTASGQMKTRTWARTDAGSPIVTTHSYGTATGSNASDLDSITYSDGTVGQQITQRDLLGRAKVLIDNAGLNTFTYTLHGALDKKEITGTGILSGVTLAYGHDGLGRQNAMAVSLSGSEKHSLSYLFEDAGRLGSVFNNQGKVVYSYHPTKQLLSQQAFQNASSQTITQGTRLYDDLNRLKSISYHSTQHTSGGTKALAYHGYTYNDLNQRTRADLLDGSHWAYGYKNTGELATAEHKNETGTALIGQQFGYSYDGVGNRLTSSDGSSSSNLPNTYSPNALNQYAHIQTSAVKYVTGKAPAGSTITLNGNATQRQAEYYAGILNAVNTTPLWQGATVSGGSQSVAGNVYVPAANVAPVYDDDGNKTDDGRWIYVWNAENRLIEMSPTAAALSAGMPYTRLKFTYDSQGQRIQRARFDSSGASTPVKVTKYIYDGWNCVVEMDASNQVEKKYAWGTDVSGSMQSAGGVGGLLWVEDEINSTKHFYGFDGNGNVATMIDTSTGVVSAEYAYNPFGETLKAVGDYAPMNRYRFSTKPQDTETGLYYYGYRYYDPVTGRWPSRDPLKEKGGVNLYAFVQNDGVNNWDLFGLTRVKRPSGTPIKPITVKRKKVEWLLIFKEKLGKHVDPNIDTYGHWWIVFGGESYGWWPKFGLGGIRETVQGVLGELNGTTNFGGTATTDPHHPDAADTEFTPKLRGGFLSLGKLKYGSASGVDCNCATDGEIQECFREFAKQYSGNWSYPLGQNCHSFQKEGMKSCCLKK